MAPGGLPRRLRRGRPSRKKHPRWTISPRRTGQRRASAWLRSAWARYRRRSCPAGRAQPERSPSTAARLAPPEATADRRNSLSPVPELPARAGTRRERLAAPRRQWADGPVRAPRPVCPAWRSPRWDPAARTCREPPASPRHRAACRPDRLARPPPWGRTPPRIPHPGPRKSLTPGRVALASRARARFPRREPPWGPETRHSAAAQRNRESKSRSAARACPAAPRPRSLRKAEPTPPGIARSARAPGPRAARRRRLARQRPARRNWMAAAIRDRKVKRVERRCQARHGALQIGCQKGRCAVSRA